MKDLLIIKNVTHEGPGILGELIGEKGIGIHTIDLGKGEKLDSPGTFGAVIILGGPDSANDESGKIKGELDFIRKTMAAGVPYLGICLGMQTLVKAAGGEVIKCDVKEIGFRDEKGELFTIRLTAGGRQDPLFEGLEDSFNVFHLHGETVVLTGAMNLLAEGTPCRNQVVKAGPRTYGIQCHFELTPEMFATWIEKDSDLHKLDKELLNSDFNRLKNEYYRTGRTLFTNFLRIAGYKV